MPVDRTPPKHESSLPNLHVSLCASNPELNTTKGKEKEKPDQLSITKRQKRTFHDVPDSAEKADSSMSEIKSMLLELKNQQEKRFDSLSISVTAVEKQTQEIKDSTDFMSKQYDELLQKVYKLETENKNYKKQINTLESKLELLEKASRSTSVEIRNIPKQDQESKQVLMNLTTEIGNVLSVKPPIQTNEFRDVYRKGTNTVVVDFASKLRKEEYLLRSREFNKTRRQAKELQLNTQYINIPGPPKTIYISESLTNKAGRMYYIGRELVKSKRIAACWTMYGKVYIKKEEGQAPIRIEEEEDLHKFSK